jgi:hypothetical protein
VQEQELFYDKKQKKDAGQAVFQEILSFLQNAHASQGDQVGFGRAGQ